jgi:hypothetical protein
MAVPPITTTTEGTSQGDGNSRVSQQDQLNSTNQDLGRGADKSNFKQSQAMDASYPDMVAKSQVQHSAGLSIIQKKDFEKTFITFRMKGTVNERCLGTSTHGLCSDYYLSLYVCLWLLCACCVWLL